MVRNISWSTESQSPMVSSIDSPLDLKDKSFSISTSSL